MRDNKKNGIANDFPNINYMVMWWSCVQFQSSKRSAAILLNQAKSAPLTVFLHLFVSPRRFMIHYVQSQHTHTTQTQNNIKMDHSFQLSARTIPHFPFKRMLSVLWLIYIYIYFVVVVRFYFICFIKRIGLGELKKTIAKKQNREKVEAKKN